MDTATTTGPAAIVIRPERITLARSDDPIGPDTTSSRGIVAQVVYLGHATQVHVDVGAPAALIVEVPNHSGPRSVTHEPGMPVNCVCTHDAVRVLHRSTATPIADPVAEEASALSLS